MEQLRIKSAVNANLQNSINTSLILHFIRNLGRTYRSEVAKALRLSLPAVSRSVDQLIESGYVREQKIITSSGKQAFEIEINALLGMAVGVSIELPFMKISKMDMSGKLVSVREVVMDTSGSALEDTILEQVKNYLLRTHYEDDRQIPVVAITLSIPAAIDLTNEKVHAVLFRSIHGINLKHLFEQTFPVPVFLENNENLAALAEKYYKDTIPENNFIYITLHHGIGAGLIIDGKLYRGANGAAGEIGYQHMGLNPFLGNASMETFETMASIHQIQNIALDFIHKGKGEEVFKAANYSYNSISHQLVGRIANEGSEDAVQILNRYAEILAIGISNVLVTLNPEIIVLGGQILDIENVDRLIIDPLKKGLKELVPFPVPPIRVTRLGKHAAVIGACQMGLEHTILSRFPYSIAGDSVQMEPNT